MKKDVSKTNDFVGGSGIGSSRDGGPSFSFFRISTSFFAKYCFNSFFKFKQSLRGVDIFTTNFFCTSLIEVKFNANLIYVKESGALNQIGYVFFRYSIERMRSNWMGSFVFDDGVSIFKKAYAKRCTATCLKFKCMHHVCSDLKFGNFQRDSATFIKNLRSIFDLLVRLS